MALVVVVLLCPKYNHCKRPESYSLAIYTVPTKLFIYSKIQTPRARPLPLAVCARDSMLQRGQSPRGVHAGVSQPGRLQRLARLNLALDAVWSSCVAVTGPPYS